MKLLRLISTSYTRRLLLILWFTFFIVHLFIFIYLYTSKFIEGVDFWPAMKCLNTMYAPYLGAITLFYWGNVRRTNKLCYNSKIAFFVAILCSLIWNSMIFIFLLPLVFLSGTIEDAIQNINNMVPLFSWLVSGAIGYYFAKSADN